MEKQTKFYTTESPIHKGNQDYLHSDVHQHIGDSDGNLIKNVGQDNHRPVNLPPDGQTTLDMFGVKKKEGLY